MPALVLSGLRQVGKSTLRQNEHSLATGRAYRTLQPGRDDLLRGALFETYVGQNLAALLEAHRPDAQLTYWHEQGRHEVDFVIEQGRDAVAIEVKAATRWSESDLSGLRAFLDRTPSCVAALLAYNGREAAQLSKLLYAIPLSHLLA